MDTVVKDNTDIPIPVSRVLAVLFPLLLWNDRQR